MDAALPFARSQVGIGIASSLMGTNWVVPVLDENPDNMCFAYMAVSSVVFYMVLVPPDSTPDQMDSLAPRSVGDRGARPIWPSRHPILFPVYRASHLTFASLYDAPRKFERKMSSTLKVKRMMRYWQPPKRSGVRYLLSDSWVCDASPQPLARTGPQRAQRARTRILARRRSRRLERVRKVLTTSSRATEPCYTSRATRPARCRRPGGLLEAKSRILAGMSVGQAGSWRVHDEQDLGSFGRGQLKRVSVDLPDGVTLRPVRDLAAGVGHRRGDERCRCGTDGAAPSFHL